MNGNGKANAMMEEPTSELTILFADICRSTVLFDTIGDQAALKLVMETLQLARTSVEHNNGRSIGTIGDELMCTFDSPADALTAANQIHSLIQKSTAMQEHQLAVRIGVNTGAVVNTGRSVYGDTVNIAARLAAQAKAHQSLVAGSTIEATAQDVSNQLRLLGGVNLQGKAGPVTVYELLQPDTEEEITEITAVNKLVSRSFLMTVKFQTRLMRFNPMLVRFLFGRSMECDQVIDHPTISREHAEFLYRNGQFIFRDFSSNGSVIVQNKNTRTLHRSSMELKGTGQIYLGRTINQPHYCIEFTCNSIGGNRVG